MENFLTILIIFIFAFSAFFYGREVIKNNYVSGNDIKNSFEELKTAIYKIDKKDVDNFSLEKQVFIVIGLNGVGKTTGIIQIAKLLKSKSVNCAVCSCDNFRTAAFEQLQLLSEKHSVDFISVEDFKTKRSAHIAIECLEKFHSHYQDGILFIDTAGRSHRVAALMQEIAALVKKVKAKSAIKVSVIMFLDAITGDKMLNAYQSFKSFVQIDLIVISKTDLIKYCRLARLLILMNRIPFGITSRDQFHILDSEMLEKFTYEIASELAI